MTLLRADLLTGRRVALSGAGPEAADAGAEAIHGALVNLGAEVELLDVASLPDEEDRVGAWARERAPLDALVHCAEPAGGAAGLKTALEEAWLAVREVAVGAMTGAERPGKLLLIARPARSAPLVEAARAGLENLVRTVSVEWARFGVTAALITPGERTTQEELAALTCFAVSEAGGYLSGCRLELGAMG